MQTEKAKSSHFDRTRGFKNQIFPTQETFLLTELQKSAGEEARKAQNKEAAGKEF